MPRSIGSRLALGSVAVASMLLSTLIATTPSIAQDATAGRTVRVAAISPFIDKDQPLRVVLQVTNPTELTLERGSIRVALFSRVSSRSQLRQALDLRSATTLIGAINQRIDGDIPPGQTRTITIERALARLPQSMRSTGVYPLEIQVTHSRGTSTLRTAVTHFAGKPPAPLNLTWILTVDRPIAIRSDGTYASEAIDALGMDELTQQMRELARVPRAPVTLALNPSLVDTIADLADGFVRRTSDATTTESATSPTAQQAAALLEAMRSAASAVGELATVPYAPAHLPALADHDLRGDLVRQITAGRSALADRLNRSAAAGFLVPPGFAIDVDAARALQTLGIDSFVVDSRTLPRQPATPFRPGLFGPSRPIEIEARRADFGALLPDEPLRARLEAPEQGVLLAQAVIAETASAWLELPGVADQRLIVLAATRVPSPPALRAAIDGLTAAPWVRLRTGGDAIDALPARGDALSLPDLAPPDTPFLAAARDARRARTVLESIAVEGTPESELDERMILLAESAEWGGAPETGAALARAVSDRVSNVVDAIDIVRRPITLTARRGDVPVTILNRNTFPVRVRVRLASAKVGFPAGSSRSVDLESQDTTIDFAVEARATGSFPLDIEVETPDGKLRITRERIVLRSTAVSAVALAVVGGSALFLVLAWFTRARRRGIPERESALHAGPGSTAIDG